MLSRVSPRYCRSRETLNTAPAAFTRIWAHQVRMQKTSLALMILTIGSVHAEAGHRHRHHGRSVQPYLIEQVPGATRDSRPMVGNTRSQTARGSDDDDVASWLPPGWQLQPTDPNWKGRRYVSPNGFEKVSIFSSQVSEEPVSAQMKEIAFVQGEQISYLRGERHWIVVSGVRDGRVFYRKAALACGGRSWHQIEFEYPFEEKRKLDSLVSQFSRRLDRYGSAGCQSNASAQ